jgi:hypothetical protein
VIVVTWNSEEVIQGCIDSLLDTLDAREWELIVIDNAPTDGTLAVVRSLQRGATVIANATNVGLAAANNQGLDAATGSLLLICNPDVIFKPDSVTALAAVMDRHPRAGWVVPRLVYEDGTLQTSAGDLPSLTETLLGRQLSRRRQSGSCTGFWWDGWAHDEERTIGRGHESAYLVRRSAIDDVGPQDPRYVLDWEGLDWTDRFRRAGWEIWLAPGAEVVHLGGNSIRQVPFRSTVSAHRGMYLFFSSRRPPAWKPALAVAFTLRASVKLALTAVGIPLYQRAYRNQQKGAPTQEMPRSRRIS